MLYGQLVPEVAVSDMTKKQMLQWLVASNQRIESQMSDLTAQVSALQEAVSGVSTRVQAIWTTSSPTCSCPGGPRRRPG